MSTDVRIPLGMGWFKTECDQARAATRRHRDSRTHERALAHEGQAVGGVQSGFHDVSFENLRWLIGLIWPSFISKLGNGRNSKESLLCCQYPATMALLPICSIARTSHLEQHHRDTPAQRAGAIPKLCRRSPGFRHTTQRAGAVVCAKARNLTQHVEPDQIVQTYWRQDGKADRAALRQAVWLAGRREGKRRTHARRAAVLGAGFTGLAINQLGWA